MMIPGIPISMRAVMSNSLSIIIVGNDLLDGFLSCRYSVLIRSPL